ncbi:MAG: hypothetical protein C4297_13470 [Gemmataceae bacterium]
MFTLLKKLWRLITALPLARNVSTTIGRPAAWPDEGPLPNLEPSEPTIYYVLPLRWSLHYALTKKQWQELRQRHKELFPDCDRCSCPKRCKANTLDEKWRYDESTHTKILLGMEFICPGCHWLKTPPWRIETWLELQNGLLPKRSEPPHIIYCLGWTQEQVDALRQSDLERHRAETLLLSCLNQQVQQGRAAIVPAPPERLSQLELEKFVRPGQVMVVPWRVDLSVLQTYGYSQREIVVFEERMYKLAAKRMSGG